MSEIPRLDDFFHLAVFWCEEPYLFCKMLFFQEKLNDWTFCNKKY